MFFWGARQNDITRKSSVGSALGKSFLDNLVCDDDGLPDRLEPAGKPLTLHLFQPGVGLAGLFEYETHFGGSPDAASGVLGRPVFCGHDRDAPDKVHGDHS